MKKLIGIIIIIIFPMLSKATNGIKSEFQIKTDNDFFVPFGNTDKYYTFGQKFFFRRRIENRNRLFIGLDRLFKAEGSSKIIEFELGQEAYTPSNFSNHHFSQYDRPFAGWLYFGSYISTITDKKIIKIGVEIGVVGPSSFAGKVQNYIHEKISNKVLQGWMYQVQDRVGINVKAAYYKPVFSRKYVDFTFENNLSIGSEEVFYQGGGKIRIGRFNPISSSIAYNTSISGKKFEPEFFIDFSSNVKLVAYNATLQQSEGSNILYLNKEVNNLLTVYSVSINYNSRHFGANYSYHVRGGDLISLGPHRYGSINLFFRC